MKKSSIFASTDDSLTVASAPYPCDKKPLVVSSGTLWLSLVSFSCMSERGRMETPPEK
ncbi:hypothetical protein JN06_02293 [Bacteroides zoogleoformans]|uniref:hypothetical protein n=1 Tax=Bacteroides zoogleoformans TaxID=28119 RepID=UPI0011AE157B|nr:hypothetical protein [Bacteroides zoogleoformans]TWJ11330.1 hypothetical protein JN06_02293 [Bacteroides zoogleoformans]